MIKSKNISLFAVSIPVLMLLALFLAGTVYALWPVKEYPSENFAGADDHFTEISGFNIRYTEAGDKENPPLVLVHGFAGSVYTWRYLIPMLSDSFYVIALDLPGFGLSDKPSDFDYSYSSQARVVREFMEKLSLEDVSLAGHSMGGNIVLNTALDYDRVSSLIMLDPGIIEDGNPEFLQYLFFPLTRISAKLFRDSDFRMASFERSYYKPEQITQEDVDAYMIASRTENFVNAMVSMLKNYSEPEDLSLASRIKQPVLLLWGEYDRGNPPENGLLLQEEFRNSELVIINESGHYIHEEQPEETARMIRIFLKDLID